MLDASFFGSLSINGTSAATQTVQVKKSLDLALILFTSVKLESTLLYSGLQIDLRQREAVLHPYSSSSSATFLGIKYGFRKPNGAGALQILALGLRDVYIPSSVLTPRHPLSWYRDFTFPVAEKRDARCFHYPAGMSGLCLGTVWQLGLDARAWATSRVRAIRIL